MGIVPLSLETLGRYIHLIGGLPGCKMMELGDQQMMTHRLIPEGIAAKEWFLQVGVKEHVSLDINGLLGSVVEDLSKPITRPEWHEHFDVVTDFGTSEHVGPDTTTLWQCRENVHRFCRPGGIMVFMNPRTNHWPRHGCHFFTKEHYDKVAEAAGYAVLEISEHATCGNYIDGVQVHAVLQKKQSGPFIPKQKFLEICHGTIFSV